MLNLNEAAQRCDVSVVTLRRAIKSGQLRHQPRRTDRDPYLLTEAELEAAGYTVLPEIKPGWRVNPPTPPSEDSRLVSDLEATRAEVTALREERESLLERVHRAEGELSATRRDFDVLSRALSPALNAIAERSTHVDSLSPAPPLRGEVMERAERPEPRHWWQRDIRAERAG